MIPLHTLIEQAKLAPEPEEEQAKQDINLSLTINLTVPKLSLPKLPKLPKPNYIAIGNIAIGNILFLSLGILAGLSILIGDLL